MDRNGDDSRDGEVLRNTERLATQHNLWTQRQEFKEQLALFETRIDEQYDEVAHNFSAVNQDLALLREATDNLNGQMAANDANMERRMDSLERAITKLGRHRRHRSTSSSSSSLQDYYSHGGLSSSSSSSRHEDHHRPHHPHARHEDSRSNSRCGEIHRHACPLERPPQDQVLQQDRHQADRHAHHGRDDQPQDQGPQDPPRRDLRRHPRQDQRGRGDPQHDQDERANNEHRQHPRQDLQQHHREPSEASVHLQRQPNAMVGRRRPPMPPQAARDEGAPPRRRNLEDEENMFGRLKFTMPKFKGEEDAEAYLSWALKVDKIFRIHNYSGAKKVAMASLEFEDYANTWWEQVLTLREEKGEPPIDTWEEMKKEMHARFVPTHYMTDLFNKLQQLKQRTKTVEEFFKEMELTMMRANIQESEEQTIARFFNGLNYPIKRIVEFQPYSNLVELVHQASKAERQVIEDIKYSKPKTYFASKLATSTPPTTSVKPDASSTSSKKPTIQSRMKQTVFSTASSKASTGPSNVTCFKCGTQGHKSF
nr:uncharacterized protein LOC127298681 isoform X1 [Lolium perenne]XP_051184490.1 uncharacterized protein LOC127298681 isoform X1 [Lolium perenne]XP_051184494.1 uncharacterized protein LOC127298681 isoform X1 [Lolium perenne]XP_051184500.1 uncharacterized protein LOC127298681 isoform X1 [Lolium perenne]XP_051184508.1 uncharacterized protein LOC127298681 isoform X1 [Lolium perenne]XP_051184515.1 uncharacterized protein LOC127298681 isoform X1 [Lolium perenne]XP_051184523.1 uncharacterized prot